MKKATAHPIYVVDVPFKRGGALLPNDEVPKSWIKGPFAHQLDVANFRRERGF